MARAGFICRFLKPCAVAAFIALVAACGDGSGPEPISPTKVARLSLLAGNLGGPGNADGTGADARFYKPRAMATDRQGNIYLTELDNGRVRKITPTGTVVTLAVLTSDIFDANRLPGIAVDSLGAVFVTDNNLLYKIAPTGSVTRFAGMGGYEGCGYADGTGTDARFCMPSGLAVDRADNLYVADQANSVIRKVTTSGIVSTLAGTPRMGGHRDGDVGDALFHSPVDVATDSAGNLYVADVGSRTIRKVDPTGAVTTLAGTAYASGSDDGIGAEARFEEPSALSTDSSGNVYVADTFNETIRKITPAGMVITLAGSVRERGSADGQGANARFDTPIGVAADSAGNVYVADHDNYTVRKVTPSGFVSTLAGAVAIEGDEDGAGAAARFSPTNDIAVDGAGNLYVGTSGPIRKVSPTGIVTTFSLDLGSTALLGASVHGSLFGKMTADRDGNLYLAGRLAIWKASPAGVLSVLAGSPWVAGSEDGAGGDARFGWCPETISFATRCQAPVGIGTDSDGNVYVTDTPNHTVRKITRSGVVTTLAGLAGVPGTLDGVGKDARFRSPAGVVVDVRGNLYVNDRGNFTIRKITPGGVVSTLAGEPGVCGAVDAAGMQARFGGSSPATAFSCAAPTALAIDSSDNVFVADTYSSTIRKVTPAGVVTTVVGVNGVKGFFPGALPGVIAEPLGVAVTGSTLYITMYQGVAVVTNVAQ